MSDLQELTDRYVAVWNEPDGDRRRKLLRELWTEDGVQILQPPREIREASAALGTRGSSSSGRATTSRA